MSEVSGERWKSWVVRVVVVAALVGVGAGLSRLWAFAHADDPAVIEDTGTARVAAYACAQMRDSAAAASVGSTSSVQQRVGAINAQNDAIITLVEAVRAVGTQRLDADQPANRWLDDWGRLVTARDAYARSLVAGKPVPMDLPVLDGTPLVDRLNKVGLNCRVPRILLAP